MTGFSEAPFREERTRDVAAPQQALWDVVAELGGDRGFYAFNRLWRVRAAADRVIGGPGMRGRPSQLRVGDELDFWRVDEVDPPRSLVLRAEMKLPGTAWLGLAVEALDGQRSRLRQRTWFVPDGLVGQVFWWTELPAHKLVFARMVEGIAAAAERRAGS